MRTYTNMEARLKLRWKIEDEVEMAIETWNDQPSRTHAEVLALLKKLDI